MLPAAEKITLVLEGIGDDKIRVNSSSLDNPVTILADQGIEIVAIEKKVDDGAAIKKAIEGVISDMAFELQPEIAERTRARA
jgi:hypothetical protein